MNKAALYRRANQLTRCDSLKIMQEFASILKSTSNGRVSLLDVGCGPGDVTAEIILPILPPDFERLVGIDISDEMLEYARKTQTHPKLSFQQFNIDVELEKQSLNGTEFDHITSFFCLMWVRNQRLCVENFYKLLKPGGDILVVFIVNTAVYDAYRHQSEDDRWSQYTNDYDRIVSPYYNSPNPRDEFNNLLKICGFTECSVRMEEKTFNCDVDEMRDLLYSVNPFIDRIPVDRKQEYLDDLMQYFIREENASGDFHMDIKTCRSNLPYTILVAYARKERVML